TLFLKEGLGEILGIKPLSTLFYKERAREVVKLPNLESNLGDLMNTPVKLVIFDWDGTLFDSVSQIVASLQFAAQQFQQPLSDEDAKSIIGLGLPEVAQRLFPNVPELHANILQSYSEHYVANSSGDSWFEGVAHMLADLQQH